MGQCAVVAQRCAPTAAATDVLLLRPIAARLRIVVQDGTDGIVSLGIVHADAECLAATGEHEVIAEAGIERPSGREVRIALVDVQRIGVVGIGDTVDKVGGMLVVGEVSLQAHLLADAVGQFQRGAQEQEAAAGQGVEGSTAVRGALR